MKRVFVDANVFLRFFTLDDGGQHDRAARIFRAAESGKIVLVTGPPVLFEVSWTLRSAYKLSREKVLDVLARIMGLSGLELTDFSLVDTALRMAQDREGEFADCYIAATIQASGADGLATFNRKDFQRLGVDLMEF